MLCWFYVASILQERFPDTTPNALRCIRAPVKMLNTGSPAEKKKTENASLATPTLSKKKEKKRKKRIRSQPASPVTAPSAEQPQEDVRLNKHRARYPFLINLEPLRFPSFKPLPISQTVGPSSSKSSLHFLSPLLPLPHPSRQQAVQLVL